MNILAVNLQRSSAINVAIYGNFSGPKQQEIVAAKGSLLELLRPDDTGKVISICSTPTFGLIRSLKSFRLAGANRDYVIIGSDSGKISIVEYDEEKKDWKLVHCETFGKTGCRRIVPGQYIAADPKGRAVMIAGIEKQRFAYVMNRDTSNKLTISSPLEAHRNETITYSVIGVDNGFENPIFAMIEMEYTEADQDPTGEAAADVEKKLTYYELDLGLNHVVRKWSEPISRTANFLLSVPGGDQWPSGVLICGENWVSYKNQGHSEIRTVLPRREGLAPERGVLITTGVLHKQKDLFFYLLQSEYGDLYKVVLEQSSADPKTVDNLVVSLFDTIQPCTSLCITKTGLLFGASEFGNHCLLQFQGIDDPNAVTSERLSDDMNEELGDDSFSASKVAPLFKPSTKLQNFLVTDEVESLAPITDMLVDDIMSEDASQILTACGRGNRSTLRILRHGVSISEMAVSDLRGRPTAVWTVKKSHDDEYDRYIIVSFSNATLVLTIGDTVEEVTDSGFLTNCATLAVALLADNALIQVHNNGIRHIRSDNRTSEWTSPGRKLIQFAAANSRQVAISLGDGEIFYFELDQTGRLEEIGVIDMGKEVSALDLGVIPEGRTRSPFLAVGAWDDTVQLLSLDPSDVLGKGPSFGVESRPTSLCLQEVVTDRTSNEGRDTSTVTALYLNVGLSSGVLLRVAVDIVTGDFSDARQRFLGPKALKLCRISVQGGPGVLALTTRSWLMYNYQNRYYQDPISYEPLTYASDFSSEACPDAIVAVAGSTLRIIVVNNLGMMFNQKSIPLKYTPRKISRISPDKDNKQVMIIETDHNEFSAEQRQKLGIPAASSNSEVVDANVEGDEVDESTTVTIRGSIPAAEGNWASAIRILDLDTANNTREETTVCLHELSDNLAAISSCMCQFLQHSEERFIVVGVVKDLTLHPKKFSACYIHVYRQLGDTLQLLHQTEVEDIPQAMTQFQDRLLVGIGRTLRLYDLGKKKLLKKCENKMFPTAIVRLQTHGDRIFVGDNSESISFVKHRRAENSFSIFADDTCLRFITSVTVLDYSTVACVDKFGNFSILRLPADANDDLQSQDASFSSSSRLLWEQGHLNGAPNKLEVLCHYYIGELATSIHKCSMKLEGKEVLLVSTISGAILAFVPCKTKEEIYFFTHLEMYMRQESPTILQRDHLSFRSYFHPLKNVVDSDLCERYSLLPLDKQKEFAEDVGRSPSDIIKKLEEIRNFF